MMAVDRLLMTVWHGCVMFAHVSWCNSMVMPSEAIFQGLPNNVQT
jgi:hypothetical protein